MKRKTWLSIGLLLGLAAVVALEACKKRSADAAYFNPDNHVETAVLTAAVGFSSGHREGFTLTFEGGNVYIVTPIHLFFGPNYDLPQVNIGTRYDVYNSARGYTIRKSRSN
jgi:hypothetical protein